MLPSAEIICKLQCWCKTGTENILEIWQPRIYFGYQKTVVDLQTLRAMEFNGVFWGCQPHVRWFKWTDVSETKEDGWGGVTLRNVVSTEPPDVTMNAGIWYRKSSVWHASLFFTLDAGLLARGQYSEGPATGHLDTGFFDVITSVGSGDIQEQSWRQRDREMLNIYG